jgi:hypothetical protein
MLHGKLIECISERALTNAERLWLLVLAAIGYQEESVERSWIEQELAPMLTGSASDIIGSLHEMVWMGWELNGVASELWASVTSRRRMNQILL